jgi:hypothetical protein
MKKLITIYAMIGLMLAISSVANATGTYADLTGRDEYRASTGLTLGTHYNPVPSGQPHENAIGYVIADEFQINLLYQDCIDDSAIDAFNDYGYPTTLNFPDNDYYFLRIDEGGSLPIGIWDYINDIQYHAPDSGESWVQWTLSYWSHSDGYYHTVFAGDMQVSGDDTTLSVRPEASYRTFLWDGFANEVEVFNGALVDSEVRAYTFSGSIGTGSISGIILVPEPATIALFGLGALSLLRRKR